MNEINANQIYSQSNYSICSIYNSYTDYDSPQELDNGDGEFKCDECPRSFQWKSNLIRHKVIN